MSWSKCQVDVNFNDFGARQKKGVCDRKSSVPYVDKYRISTKRSVASHFSIRKN